MLYVYGVDSTLQLHLTPISLEAQWQAILTVLSDYLVPIHPWLYSPLLGLSFSFSVLYTVDGTPCTGDLQIKFASLDSFFLT
jgi:hypothetical protein